MAGCLSQLPAKMVGAMLRLGAIEDICGPQFAPSLAPTASVIGRWECATGRGVQINALVASGFRRRWFPFFTLMVRCRVVVIVDG